MPRQPRAARRLPLSRAALLLAAAAAVSPFAVCPKTAPAQSVARNLSAGAFGGGFRFSEQSGEALYANSCQACHMPDGRGATGAGTYPSLAGNLALHSGGHVVSLVVNGQRGMPPVGYFMNDAQVAAVVNYVRTHFGNDYPDPVTAEDVKGIRR